MLPDGKAKNASARGLELRDQEPNASSVGARVAGCWGLLEHQGRTLTKGVGSISELARLRTLQVGFPLVSA